MGRAPCCDKANVKRGPWSPDEDMALKNYLHKHGTAGNWIALPHKAGLKRCGKSCRLRWLNYLRPDIKHGGFTEEEDHIICSLYNNIGSRWSVIASQLQGRTDNDVKNYWNTKLKKKILAGKINLPTNNTTLDQPTSSHSSSFMPNAPMITQDFTIPGQIVSSEFDLVSANTSHIVSSSCSDGSSFSMSSPFPLEHSWWTSNGMEEYDGFFTEFGFESTYDLLSGPAAANYTIFDSFLSPTNSDTKSQGVFQSITN